MKDEEQSSWRDSLGADFMEEREDGRFLLTRTDSMIIKCIAAANDTTPYKVLGSWIEAFLNTCDRTLENDSLRK